MYTEFWPGVGSSKDWSSNLPDLRDSFRPILHIANAHEDQASLLDEQTQKSIADVCGDFEESVNEAIRLFQAALDNENRGDDGDFSRPHIKAIVSATRIVSGAYLDLVQYNNVLKAFVAPEGFNYQTMLRPFCDSEGKFSKQLEAQFDSALTDANKSARGPAEVSGDIDRCMTTRKLYLVSCHFNYMFPYLWDRSSHSGAARTAMQSVLETMQQGTSFRKSVLTRIDDFVHYDERLHFDRRLAA